MLNLFYFWLCWVFIVVWGLLQLRCTGLSYCRTWALECRSSLIVAHRLSYPVACGILVPWLGIERKSPALEDEFFWLFFQLKKLIYFNWRIITLQYCGGFCHTLTWIGHRYTCLLILNPPPTFLPTHPSGLSQSTSFECPASCIELGLVFYFTCFKVTWFLQNNKLECFYPITTIHTWSKFWSFSMWFLNMVLLSFEMAYLFQQAYMYCQIYYITVLYWNNGCSVLIA